MNLTNKQSKEIYEQFHDEKIIFSIKNPNLKINFIKSYIWIFPLFIVLGFSLNPYIFEWLNAEQKIMALLVIFGAIAVSFIGFLSQFCTFYFEDNNLILENKLKNKKIIDISRYPRIYIRYKNSLSYNTVEDMYQYKQNYKLHIEQDTNDIALDVKVIGGNKVSLLLDSLLIKKKCEVSETQWESSVNEREKNYDSLIKFLRSKKRIIGVKDTSKNMKIQTDTSVLFNFLKILFTALLIFILYLFAIKEWMIVAYIVAFAVVMIIVLKEVKDRLFIKISYPSDNTIRINKYILDYKNNNVMISFMALQFPNSNNKYDYKLVLSGPNHHYSIDLLDAKKENIEKFISNLIFEEY